MVICGRCKLLQLEHNFDANEMSGENRFLKEGGKLIFPLPDIEIV